LLKTQDARNSLFSAHHRTTLSGYALATKVYIDIRKKVVKQQYLVRMSSQLDNFSSLMAEIDWRVSRTPANFNGFFCLGFVTASTTLNGGQPNFA